jgi:hypothetical protein
MNSEIQDYNNNPENRVKVTQYPDLSDYERRGGNPSWEDIEKINYMLRETVYKDYADIYCLGSKYENEISDNYVGNKIINEMLEKDSEENKVLNERLGMTGINSYRRIQMLLKEESNKWFKKRNGEMIDKIIDNLQRVLAYIRFKNKRLEKLIPKEFRPGIRVHNKVWNLGEGELKDKLYALKVIQNYQLCENIMEELRFEAECLEILG